MLIKKVLLNKNNNTKYLVIPKKSEIKAGDYVKIEVIEEGKEEKKDDRSSNNNKRAIQ